MKRFFEYLQTRPLAFASVIVLGALYVAMAFAEFFAPYPAALTFENNTFHPANIQLSARGIKVREYRVIDRTVWKYARVKDAECIHRLRWFVKGSEYKLFGVIPCARHLFGSASDYPAYLLGADNLGRDLLSRIVYGSRISLTIGFVATAVSLLLAVMLGGLAGYWGGAADWSIMRFAEFFMLIPALYFILFLRSLLNTQMDSGASYMIITLILALVGWPGSARTIRGLVHSIKREDFVLNAHLEGIPPHVIIFRYIIPETASLLIVSVALSIPGFIMSETTLSYLGLGICDPAVSWGSLINRDISTLSNLHNYPWLLFPVLALLVTTLAFNFFADALRDFFDPYNAVFRKKSLQRFMKKHIKQYEGSGHFADEAECGKGERQDGEIPLLSVRDLRVTFCILRGRQQRAVEAVRGISFDVMRGEILGLVGESGSGKSVSTAAIPGLLTSNAWRSGRIFYEGTELTALNQDALRAYRGAKIALIFQEPGRSFDPLQNIGSVFFEAFRATDRKITKKEAYLRAERLLQDVGLPDPRTRLSAYPHQFSGGQLQRIGIALALAQDCRLLIADEPTTALDVTIQAQIVSLLLRLKEEKGLSIIFISHDIELVAEISDRIAVMYRGKIIETAPAKSIMTCPQHAYTKSLIASIPGRRDGDAG